MKRMTEAGVEWLYRPGFVYVAKYRALNLKVERCPAGAAKGGGWRLFAGRGHGIGLAFDHQFWPTAKAARAEGRRLAEEAFAKIPDLQTSVLRQGALNTLAAVAGKKRTRRIR